jgi:nucleotide-binding universal stress UspA family protein
MTPVLLVTVLVLGAALAVFCALYVRDRRQRARTMQSSAKRILFPFVRLALSRRALDAALRLARADGATLVPVFLVRVPMRLPLDTPLPRQCAQGMPLLETIEQRAVALGVQVDTRIERGRTYRHALREAIAHERYDRLVVAAASTRSEGFHSEDIAWLLDHAPGEVVIIRPDRDDRINGSGGVDKLRHRDRGATNGTPQIDRAGPRPIGVG